MSIQTVDGKVISPGDVRATTISGTAACTIGVAGAGNVRLLGLLFHTALTGTCVVAGFRRVAGTTYSDQSITFPAASAAGFRDFMGALNDAGTLTITCSNAGDEAKVVAFWTVM